MAVYDGAGVAPLVLQEGGGNVGIGTTAPSYLLHVAGTAYATGAAGALSDIRHKRNVKTLADGALAIVNKLRPVSFVWKKPADDGMKGEQFGFIAQEVEKVLPQLVLSQGDADQTKGLKPTEMIPLLVKAMQEQQAELEALRGLLEQTLAPNDDVVRHLRDEVERRPAGACRNRDSVEPRDLLAERP
jgi:hypothetical protein